MIATGAVLIFDEVQCGLGRTGRMLACQTDGVMPDLLCLGKALGGGVMPTAAIMGTEPAFSPLLKDPFFHTSTFGGNPLACVAALTTLKILLRERLAENALVRGEELQRGLHQLARDYPHLITEVRGRGLMIGVEFAEAALVGALLPKMRKRRILLSPTLNESRVVRLEPPLTLTALHVRMILSELSDVLLEVDRELAK